MLSYHFNQQDVELYESRRYLEKFKLSYDYRKQSLVQNSIRKKVNKKFDNYDKKKLDKAPIIKIENMERI